MKSMSSDVCEAVVSAGRAWSRGRFERAVVVEDGRVGFASAGELMRCEDALVGPLDLRNPANSRVESPVARASRACPAAAGFVGIGIREEIGMCLGDSAGLLLPMDVTSDVAFDETEFRGRDESSAGGPVFFKNSARSEVPDVSDRGMGRGISGKVISLTLLGVKV